MHEIVPDVFTWSWCSEPHGYTFNGHLVRDVGGNICIDPETPDEAVLEELADFGAAKILITNRNHSRAANLLRSRLGARTAIHPEDVGHARAQVTEIDDTLRPGDRPARGDRRSRQVARRGRALWRERRILIVGDAVIGHPPSACGLLPDKVMDDPRRLRASIRGLLDLDFDILLVGDGVSILSGARDRVRELASSFAD